MNGQTLIALEDASGISEARQRAATLARTLGFDATSAGELALGVTEAAGNIVKHASRGKILLRAVEHGRLPAVEVIAMDQGPGIASLAESMRDGHSTAGSPGTGLGALRRMTRELDIWSRPGKGMVLRFEVGPKPPSGASASRGWDVVVGAVSLPKPGESANGDAWMLAHASGKARLLVVDGLGHGPAAASAAQAAVASAAKHAMAAPAQTLEAVDAALRSTRGAAGAAIQIQLQQQLCTFCGVGNIAACVISSGRTRSMVSHNGILGHSARKMQEFQYPFPQGALLVAHSDGIGTRWDLADYPGLEQRHPALVAAMLYRDYLRGRDDATVVALRVEESP